MDLRNSRSLDEQLFKALAEMSEDLATLEHRTFRTSTSISNENVKRANSGDFFILPCSVKGFVG